MKKTVFSILLAACVILATMPFYVFAENGGTTGDIQFEEPAEQNPDEGEDEAEKPGEPPALNLDEDQPNKEHHWDSGDITKFTSCTEEGEITYHCTDENCNETKIESIPKLGHSWDYKWEQSKAPGCTEKGERICHCWDCGAVYSIDISPTGHKFNSDGQCQNCSFITNVEQITGTYRPLKITLDKDNTSYSFSYNSDCLQRFNSTYAKPEKYYASMYVRTSQETTANQDNEDLLYIKDSEYAAFNPSAFWGNAANSFSKYGTYWYVSGYNNDYHAGNIITVSIDPDKIGNDKVVVVAGLTGIYGSYNWKFVDKDRNPIEGYSRGTYSGYGVGFPADPDGYKDEKGTWAFKDWYDQYGIAANKDNFNLYDDLVLHPEYTEGCEVSFVDGETKLESFITVKGTMLKPLDSRIAAIRISPADDEAFDKWIDKDGRELGSFEITEDTEFHAVYKELTGEKIVFHKVTHANEFVKGAHYIFTYSGSKDSNARIALTTDEDKNFAKLVTVNADTNQIKISAADEAVFTASSADVNGETANCKFKASNGQLMKLGTDSSNPTPMFNEKGGTITVSTGTSDENWYVANSGRYLLYNTGKQYFHADKYTSSADRNLIEIWTDADVAPEEFTYARTQTISNQGGNVFVYTDEDGTKYALTSKGAETVNMGDSITVGEESIPVIKTAKKNAWNGSKAWTSSANWPGPYTKFENYTLYRKSSYIFPSNSGVVSSSYSIARVFFDYSKDSSFKNPAVTIASNDEHYYIAWDKAEKKFYATENAREAAAFDIYNEYVDESSSDSSYCRITDLSALDEAGRFVMVAVTTDADGNKVRKAITSSGNGYLADVEIDDKGILEISSEKNSSLREVAEFTHGDITGSGQGNRKYDSLKTLKGSYYTPDETKAALFSNKPKEVRIEVKDGKFYLRGNNSKRWLSYNSESGKLTLVDDSGEKVEIEFYAATENELASVTYNSIDGHIDNTIYTSGSFAPESRDDVFVKAGEAVESETADATVYSLVGWTIDKAKAGYLSLEESSNIYEYNDELQTGAVTDEIAAKYNLVGCCNPDGYSVNAKDYLDDNKANLNLYPVYAVRGFSTAAASADESGKAIVSISDWKMQEGEGEGKYDDDDKEKWLGSIDVEVYLDGEKYGSTEKMYFRYHNDDSADINLKFVADKILNEKYDGDLYEYTSDQSNYPEKSQAGNYTIDGVYAVQGASEDGLTCKYNWMTSHGGQLDNVKGGTIVKVYLTSLYQVEYFFDDDGDGKYDELTGAAWQNGNSYSTPGTEIAFGDKQGSFGISAVAPYQVTSENENKDLMNQVDEYDNWFFDGRMSNKDEDTRSLMNDSGAAGSGRTTYAGFAYHITDWNHTIPIAALPAAGPGYVLTSGTWSLNDNDGKAYEQIKPSSEFKVMGGAYTSEAADGSNTHETFVDGDDITHTYHLYIAAKKSYAGDITPPDEPDDDSPVPSTPDEDFDGDAMGSHDSDSDDDDSVTADPLGDDEDENPLDLVKTGDMTNMILWTIIFVFAVLSLAGTIIIRFTRRTITRR